MDATRARLGFRASHVSARIEWPATVMLSVAALVVGSLLVRELRFAPWSFASTAALASTVAPVREEVSVPTLVLAAGREVHVGESRVEAVASLTPLTLLNRSEEEGPLGVREVRSYQGVTLVFEPFERAGAPRVAAIYLQ
jgi:hypothetical protein